MKNIVPIENAIDIYNPNILWADLSPQYPGYQLSNTGIIRSMKFYKKYPFGILLEAGNNIYKLSNSLNQVEQVNINDLIKIRREYTISTICTNPYSRNPLITSQSDRMKKKIDMQKELQKPSGFHFKTID